MYRHMYTYILGCASPAQDFLPVTTGKKYICRICRIPFYSSFATVTGRGASPWQKKTCILHLVYPRDTWEMSDGNYFWQAIATIILPLYFLNVNEEHLRENARNVWRFAVENPRNTCRFVHVFP